VKSSSSSMTFRDGCSAGAPADVAGFCAPCIVAVVPPWEQCTSAVTVMLWLPERDVTGEADLGVCGTGSLSLSLGGGLLSAHIVASLHLDQCNIQWRGVWPGRAVPSGVKMGYHRSTAARFGSHC
jgi:hypothetical protein